MINILMQVKGQGHKGQGHMVHLFVPMPSKV